MVVKKYQDLKMKGNEFPLFQEHPVTFPEVFEMMQRVKNRDIIKTTYVLTISILIFSPT